MKPQIPWLRVFVEGVVIVGSILLAFGLQAWWEGRQEEAEEAVLLGSLSAEIELNLDSLDIWQDTIRFAGNRATALLELTGPDAEPMDAVSFSVHLIEAASWTTFHPSTGAISAVLGRLSLIRSEELRKEVAGFGERLRDFQENFEWASQETGGLLALVQDEVPLYTSDNAAWTRTESSVDTRSILRDVEFANLLGLWVWRVDKMSTEAADLSENLRRMLALIETEGVA